MRWWKVFGRAAKPGRSEGRQRQSERFAHRAPVSGKCSSWPKFVELFTGDISSGGLFVPTDQPATLGEAIELELELPDHSTIALRGIIVNVVTPAEAAGRGSAAGIGIRFDEPDESKSRRLDLLLEVARSRQLRPAETPPSARPKPFRAPTGAEPVRLSSVHNALGAEFIEQINLAELAELHPAPADPLDDPLDDIAWEASVEPTPEQASPPSITPRQSTSAGPIIGIDLGTSNTSVAGVVGDRVKLLVDDDGMTSFPSVIHIAGGAVVVGAPAVARLAADPARTIVSPKRLLGRDYDDAEIQGFIGQAAYRSHRGPDRSAVIEIDGNDYAVVQLCSYLIDRARQIAEARLDERVERAVISVPVSFTPERVELMRRAGRIAGVDVIAVIDEPSAAALANRFDPGFGGIVGVYDFGGGTFDFSIVDVSAGDFVVLATGGDRWLGGDDFDLVLAEAAADQFWRKHKVDIRNQAVEWRALLSECERAKRDLSINEIAAVVVPDVLRTAQGSIDLRFTIDRAIFERACSSVIRRSLETCREALDLLKLQPGALSAVYLSGGTTRIPAVQRLVAQAFGVPIRTGVPPEHAVCLGTAIHAAQIQLRAETTLG